MAGGLSINADGADTTVTGAGHAGDPRERDGDDGGGNNNDINA